MRNVAARLGTLARRMPSQGAWAVAVLGAALVVAGCLGPWAQFPFGYPGKMTLSGFPGGARVFPLALVAVTPVLAWAGVPRRRAGLVGAGGIIAITGGNLLSIADGGGGLGAVAWGAWVALVGGLLLAFAFAALPDDPEPAEWRRLPAPLELVAIAVALGALLYAVVKGLDIVESSRFLSFVAFVTTVAFVLQAIGVLAWLRDASARQRPAAIMLAAATAAAFPFTQGGSGYWVRVFASIGVFAAAAIGLNVVVGLAGLLDLGYIAFFGVGAYVGGLFANAGLTTMHIHLPFLLVVLLGASIAAVFGVIIGAPTLRLRGDYLAIVTLGFGEIFRITANNWVGLTRGPNGIAQIPNVAVGGFDFGESHRVLGVELAGFANYYFIELVLVAVAIVAFTRLNESRIGRAWVAIREDETAAAAMGINTVRLKLLAFAIGAFMAGAAGTVNSHVTTQVSPDSYTFLESILLLAAVVLGGMGTVTGALLGATVLFVIPEKLRSFQDKRLLLFGIALILLMRFRPEGIVASRRRQREFHDDDSGDNTGDNTAADAMSGPPNAPVAT
ncbi:MAG TPA: hypothetical protein VM030_04930 [Acidimicrobiales bacterium]|nr:hypothetical protein [Acidimicrobiales bacterium]